MIYVIFNIAELILAILFLLINSISWKYYKKEVKEKSKNAYSKLNKKYNKCFDIAKKLMARTDIRFKERNELYNSFIDLYYDIEEVNNLYAEDKR